MTLKFPVPVYYFSILRSWVFSTLNHRICFPIVRNNTYTGKIVMHVNFKTYNPPFVRVVTGVMDLPLQSPPARAAL